MIPAQLAPSNATNPVRAALRQSRLTLYGVAIISGVINVLALTGSIYMLQIYDRVLPSRSVETLVALSVLMVGLLMAFGLLDYLRTRIMARVGLRIDQRLRGEIFKVIVRMPLRMSSNSDGLGAVRDLDAVRGFYSGPAPAALFDLPWIPVYLLLIWALHPWLGAMALAGAALLLVLALVTEARSRAPMRAAATTASSRFALAEQARRNAEVIRAMGLEGRIGEVWRQASAAFLTDQSRAQSAGSGLGAVSKFLRLLLQSAILGLGAWLVIREEATGGVMIAASIALGRALAPIEVAIANWRSFLGCRQSLQRLSQLVPTLAADREMMSLPRPAASLAVQGLWVAPPGSARPAIQNVSFSLQAGAGLAVIGPSASGKSTLARALVGAWTPQRGTVRLDGATLDQWSPDDLGRHIGYLSQEIELFDGTIAENIARFDPAATSDEVISAATLAGVHEMVVALPEGYNTRIGENGTALSAGQRQRIALARALFRDPFLVVLDEPNSNLDLQGDTALSEAVKAVRARGGIAVVVAHRPSALAGLDETLVLNQGQVQMLGPKDEVLKKVAPPSAKTVAAPLAVARPGHGFKVVSDTGQGGA